MVKPGFRTPAQASKKDRLNNIETELANLQMAGRMSQLMTQQLMANIKGMSADLHSALQELYELQYKFKAIQEHLKIPSQTLDEIANAKRLVDFDAASVKEDATEGLVAADTVDADSTVTITSTAKDEAGLDKGILRSRLKLSESGVPDLITALAGKKVGDKVAVKLNGLDHEVTLLAIRKPTAVEAQAETAH